MEGKSIRSYTAILFCGVAITCAVMYLTTDGEAFGSETVLASATKFSTLKVRSVNIEKVGRIYTSVPRKKGGHTRLLDYMKEMQKSIDNEVEARELNIQQLREKMRRNRAYNANARRKMKAALLHRMAVNAKKAKDDLDRAMAWTARTFAKQAALANRRNAANIARSKKTREIMRKNKRKAARDLRTAVLNQQRSLAALASKTNEKIRQTNTHIAANAAQIRENARVARRDLSNADRRFSRKMFAYSANARAGRSRLAAKSAQMNKRLRYMVATKVKAITASTSAQFRRVRARMARDRLHADMMLKQSTTKLAAALHMEKVLNNKRFAATVKNLNKVKRQTAKRIRSAQQYFKVNILQLRSTVKRQVGKLNSRVTTLKGTINKNRLDQDKINNAVNKEMKRMIALGNAREAYLAKSDRRLRALQKKSVQETDAAIKRQAKTFDMAVRRIRAKMARNRKHANRMLQKKTAELYKVLADNAKRQAATNAKLTAATRRARLEAFHNLRTAKKDFASRLAKLTAVVIRNDKKADRKIKHLAGVETRNALRSYNGRRMLRIMQNSNKNEMKFHISQMLKKGERRALAVQKRVTKMNQVTRTQMNAKITMEISKVAKRTHMSIEQLALENKSARAALKKEITFAVKSAAQLAKKNLKKMVSWSNRKFIALDKKLAAASSKAALGRGMLMKSIKAERKRAIRALQYSVAIQNRALFALKAETAAKIKKTDRRVDAFAHNLAKWSKVVDAQMKSNTQTLITKINDARIAANAKLSKAKASSLARYKKSLKLVATSLAKARKKSKLQFRAAYKKMAADRAASDRALARTDIQLTQKIAKYSALYDARFKKTVKDVTAARAAARAEVADAKKAYTTSIAKLRASIKDSETRLSGEISKVSSEYQSQKTEQAKINRRNLAEQKRIRKLMDQHQSSSEKARGRLRALIYKYRKLAKAEKNRLSKSANYRLGELDRLVARQQRQVRRDLVSATRGLHSRLTLAQRRQAAAQKNINSALNTASLNAKSSLTGAVQSWKAKLVTLTNTITAGRKRFEKGLASVTKVAQSWKKGSAKDRALLKKQAKAMQQQLHASLLNAIAVGTAKAKRAEEVAASNIKKFKNSFSALVDQRIEAMADQVYKALDKKRQRIANNYLSLKAYCAAASGKIISYTTTNRGQGLSAVGDVLATISAMSNVKTKPARGVSAGLKKVVSLFGGKSMKGSTALSKYNGLVNEYTKIMVLVRRRWPYGLGHYLLGKIAVSIQKTGLLKYTKVSGKAGQQVVVDGLTVGLANKLPDFDKLAVHVYKFRRALTILAKELPPSIKTSSIQYSPPVWWAGN